MVKFWSEVACILEVGDILKIGIDVECSVFLFEVEFDVMRCNIVELIWLILGVLINIGLLGIVGRVVLSNVLILEVWKEGGSNILVLKEVEGL